MSVTRLPSVKPKSTLLPKARSRPSEVRLAAREEGWAATGGAVDQGVDTQNAGRGQPNVCANGAAAPPRPVQNTPLIVVRDLVRVYRTGDIEFRALRGVSFSIDKGEFVAVMGMSGSGKSTLMNILGLLDRPTSGSYALGGVETTTLSKDAVGDVRGRTIGFVFQQFHLLPRTPAIENVELPLLYRSDVRARDRKSQALDALRRVGLGDKQRNQPTQLSGGQQQRVAIARALVTNPPILLADEPTGNLDSRTGLEILALFQELHGEGRTVVMVTHEPDVAACCSRILVLKDGLVLSDRRVEQPTNAAAVLKSLPPVVDETPHPSLT
jgi:putative ABC transport system ATP-binding protein